MRPMMSRSGAAHIERLREERRDRGPARRRPSRPAAVAAAQETQAPVKLARLKDQLTPDIIA
jgi:hypothetical protein